MTDFIVLTLAQCDKLFPADPKTGSRERLSKAGHALNPAPLAGDTDFILPLEVLGDPEHAETLKALAGQPYDDTAVKTLPLEKRPKPVDSKNALDIKNPALRRKVLPTKFKVANPKAKKPERKA